MSAPPQPTPEAVRRIVCRYLPHETPNALSDDRPLASAAGGLDSISLVELLLDCEQAFDVTVAHALLERDALSVGALVDAIMRAWVGQRPG